MKVMNSNRNAWVAILIIFAAAFFSLGEYISIWWLLLTSAASLAVWTMIWLWPEKVPAED